MTSELGFYFCNPKEGEMPTSKKIPLEIKILNSIGYAILAIVSVVFFYSGIMAFIKIPFSNYPW